MGLVADEVLTEAVLPADEVITVSSGIVTDALTVHTATRICNDSGSTIPYNIQTAFDKSIYHILSMQNDMKTVAAKSRVTNEWDKFLVECEKLHAGETVSDDFLALNEYLGNIGVLYGVC